MKDDMNFQLKLDEIARKRALYVEQKFAKLNGLRGNSQHGHGAIKSVNGKQRHRKSHRRQSRHSIKK